MSVPEALDVHDVDDDEPDLLRAIAEAADEEAALAALYELSWEILHQGTVYPHTAPAARQLAELLPATGGLLRGYIVDLLGDLAHSYDLDPGDPIRAEVLAAVTEQVDRILPLLADAHPWTRYAAAYALSGCPQRKAGVEPALRQRWAEEADPRVRAGLVMAVTALDRRTDLVEEALAPGQPAAVRAGAVLAIVQSGRRWPGKRAVAAVREAWRDGDPFAVAGADSDQRWQPKAFYAGALEDLLDRLGPAERPPIVAALLDSPDPKVRAEAAMQAGDAIGESRSVRGPLTHVLIPSLTDPDPLVRLAAAEAIRRAGPAAADAADALAAVVERHAETHSHERHAETHTHARDDKGHERHAGTYDDAHDAHDGTHSHERDDAHDEAAGQALAALFELGDPRAARHLPAFIRSGAAADDIGASLAAAGTPATAELLDAVRHRLSVLTTEPPAAKRHIDVLRSRPGHAHYSDSELTTLLILVTSWGPAAAPLVTELTNLLRTGRCGERILHTLAAIGPAAIPALPALEAHAEAIRSDSDDDFDDDPDNDPDDDDDPDDHHDHDDHDDGGDDDDDDEDSDEDSDDDDDSDYDPELMAVAHARWRITGDPEPAIDEAWRHLGARGAVDLLEQIGAPARRLVPQIRQAHPGWLETSEWYNSERIDASRMVWQWTGDPALASAIVRVFFDIRVGSGWSFGRIEAAILAVELGEHAAIPDVTELATGGHGSYAQQVRACRALWRLTGDPGPGLPAMLKHMMTADYAPTADSWTLVLDLLAELGPAAAPVLGSLKKHAERDETIARPGAVGNPGHADDQIRAAIRTTVQAIEAAA